MQFSNGVENDDCTGLKAGYAFRGVTDGHMSILCEAISEKTSRCDSSNPGDQAASAWNVRLGAPADSRTDQGPLVSFRQRDRVAAMVDRSRSGASVGAPAGSMAAEKR